MHPSKSPIEVSVIIPVLNEAANLPRCLAAVRAGGDDNVEIIVVDGDSSDSSVSVARTGGAAVLHSPVCLRAAQMNLGAAKARGDLILFLHADTLLPTGWLQAMRSAFTRRPDSVGGAFRRRFSPGSPWLTVNCILADWRGRLFGWFLGDQAMFVRREIFAALGGFAPLRTCEDIDFSIRLARCGSTTIARAVVVSSGRRFLARGGFRQTLADFGHVWRFLRARDTFLDTEHQEHASVSSRQTNPRAWE